MATISTEVGHQVALGRIRVPENVRALDDAHVQALAGSIALQGMLVPVVVRAHGDSFELVAGFHRIAAAKSLGLAEVPVVIRDARSEEADRAIENITSCRRRHEVIYAERVVMPMSELSAPLFVVNPGGEVGIRTWTDPGSQAAANDLAEVGAAARLGKRERHRHPARRSRFVPSDRLVGVDGDACLPAEHERRSRSGMPFPDTEGRSVSHRVRRARGSWCWPIGSCPGSATSAGRSD